MIAIVMKKNVIINYILNTILVEKKGGHITIFERCDHGQHFDRHQMGWERAGLTLHMLSSQLCYVFMVLSIDMIEFIIRERDSRGHPPSGHQYL